MIEVPKHYPGAMIVIAYDMDFLKAMAIQEYHEVVNDRSCRIVLS